MAHEEVVAAGSADWPFTDARPFLRWGLAACGVAFTLYTLPIWAFQLTGANLGRFALVGTGWVLLRVLLLVVGILAIGAAVTTKPKSPSVLALAALAALTARWAMDLEWDTARLVMGLLTFVALFAAFLLLLPFLVGKIFSIWAFAFSGHRNPDLEGAEACGRFAGWALSRVIIVVLVLLHFVGIASAIMSVPPASNEPSWLFRYLNTTYQPYLQFFYLNNAYRFYSPQPGPPTLLWFYIEYADGSAQWLKLPTREIHNKDPLGQEFTRRLSIGESINQSSPITQVPELAKQKRIHAGTLYDIPPHPAQALDMQYAEPAEPAKRLLREYARYVARHVPSAKDPSSQVTGVKIYRVVHGMLNPPDMAAEGEERQEPTDEWTYLPYFQGEYDKDGNLKDPDDPFLYWAIPIFRWPRGVPVAPPTGMMPPPAHPAGGYTVYNYLEKHAQRGSKGEDKRP